jgi:hypothetical protein
LGEDSCAARVEVWLEAEVRVVLCGEAAARAIESVLSRIEVVRERNIDFPSLKRNLLSFILKAD